MSLCSALVSCAQSCASSTEHRAALGMDARQKFSDCDVGLVISTAFWWIKLSWIPSTNNLPKPCPAEARTVPLAQASPAQPKPEKPASDSLLEAQQKTRIVQPRAKAENSSRGERVQIRKNIVTWKSQHTL